MMPFKEGSLSYDVWNTKYRYNNESWDEFINRLYTSFKYEDNQKKDHKDLSDFGKEVFSDSNILNSYIKKYLEDMTIIPGGSVLASVGTDKLTSLSNCFVVPLIEDSMNGIMETAKTLAEIYKRRGGCGADLSTLRPRGAKVSNANSASTGVVPFMELYSQITQTVASEGRRGALLLALDIKHPDSLEFIKSKQDLTKITGANISIKVDKEFMDAVKNDKDFLLRYPIDSNIDLKTIDDLPYNQLIKIGEAFPSEKRIYLKKVKAKEVWDEFIKCTHAAAEPGLLFWDKMTNYSLADVYPEFKTISTNPCGEIGLSALDSCRLIAVNLYNLVQNKFDKYSNISLSDVYKAFYIAQIMGDKLVDLELDAIAKIIQNTSGDEKDLWTKIYCIGHNGRRTGIGFTALGDVYAALGFSYGEESFTESIMHTMMQAELDATIDLAILNKPFPSWNKKLELKSSELHLFIKEAFPDQYDKMIDYGRRNISFSTVAPTGSLSILCNNQSSSGMEPQFSLYYNRRKKCLDGETPDFTDQNGIGFKTYPVIAGAYIDWLKYKGYWKENITVKELDKYYPESPWYKQCANDLDWKIRIKTQGLIQQYITHSISSTCNLPSTFSIEDMSNLYMTAYESGLKGVTTYLDGCRAGILVKDTPKKKEDPIQETQVFDSIEPISREELGQSLNGTTSKYHTACGTLYVTINKDENGNIVEIFTNSSKNGTCKANLNGETRMASLALRSGVKVCEVVDQLKGIHCQACVRARAKNQNIDGVSCPDIISKAILDAYDSKTIISTKKKRKSLKSKENDVSEEVLMSSEICPECGSKLDHVGGCVQCSCGYSKCG